MHNAEARRRSLAIAARIVSGELDPYDGAMTIWKTILETLPDPIPDDLWPFKSCASAIEDYVWNFEQGGANADAEIIREKEEIVRAATALIATTGIRSNES